jgi:hypothetical protein
VQATRYKLRFLAGASTTAATYGGGGYGDLSYGQRASDPLEGIMYMPIPLDAGYPTQPSWLYRRGDTEPAFRAQIRADEIYVLNLTGVARARLVLGRVDGSERERRLYPLAFEDRVKGIVRRDWVEGDLSGERGTFNVGIVLDYNSGRRLSIPHDSRHVFVITAQDVLP